MMKKVSVAPQVSNLLVTWMLTFVPDSATRFRRIRTLEDVSQIQQHALHANMVMNKSNFTQARDHGHGSKSRNCVDELECRQNSPQKITVTTSVQSKTERSRVGSDPGASRKQCDWAMAFSN